MDQEFKGEVPIGVAFYYNKLTNSTTCKQPPNIIRHPQLVQQILIVIIGTYNNSTTQAIISSNVIGMS